QNGRPERGMPAFPLAGEDVTAVVEYVHSLTAASPGQGAPPRTEVPSPNIVVGDAEEGRTYFASKCSSCHSADGDLRGVATRFSDAKQLQNVWVSGGTAGFGRGRGRGGNDAPAVTATITTRGGEAVKGRVTFIDDF